MLRKSVFAVSVALNVSLIWLLVSGHYERATTPAMTTAEFAPGRGQGHFLLTFSTPMQTEIGEDQPARPFVFTPAFDYEHLWQSDTEAVVLPKTPLVPGKEFVVRAAPELCDANGKRLKQDLLAVLTPDFELKNVWVAERPSMNKTKITFDFNGPVSPVALAQFLKIELSDGNTLEFDARMTEAVYHPTVEFMQPTDCNAVTVTVAPGLIAAGGDRGLGETFSKRIALGEGVSIGEMTAQTSGTDVYLLCPISDMIPDSVAATHVQVTPPVAVTFRSSYWDSRTRIVGDFKPRTFYRILFKEGLRTADGHFLRNDVHRAVLTGDIGPTLEFATEGPYFPRHRDLSLPLRLCNVDKVRLTATRIYPNNLVAFYREGKYDLDEKGRRVGETEFFPAIAPNTADVVNAPLGELLGDARTGVYQIQAVKGTDYWPRTWRTVVLTDLALTANAGAESVAVWVMGLGGNRAVADCDVEVLSYRNQTLGTGRTDARGIAHVDISSALEDELPYLVVARKGDDISFLGLNGDYRHSLPHVSDSSRGYPDGGYEAYVYTERGVCRPGETIVISAMLRDDDLRSVGGFPGQLRVIDPRGKLFYTAPLDMPETGFVTAAVSFPQHARTGTYHATIGVPGDPDGADTPAWGRCEFRVSNYVPDRMRVEMLLDRVSCRPGEKLEAQLQAEYYFGRPVTDQETVLLVQFTEEAFEPRRFPEFTFGEPGRKLKVPKMSSNRFRTDARGIVRYRIDLPTDVEAPAAISVSAVGEVRESGGRSVYGVAEAVLHPCDYYVGLKRLWDDGEPPSGPLSVAWVAVSPEEEAVSPTSPLKYWLTRKQWNYVLKKNGNGRYYRDWDEETLPVFEGTIDVPAGQTQGTFQIECPRYGSYSLVVAGADGKARTATSFWYWAGDGGGARPTHTTALEVATDRSIYKPGDTATLTFQSPSAGQALVCVCDRDVRHVTTLKVEEGANDVVVDVPRTLHGSVYVSITSVRDEQQGSVLPKRLFGFAHLKLDQTTRRLAVGLTLPQQAKPGETVDVDVLLLRDDAPAPGHVQLFGVDKGILALTGYKTPDPFAFFFGERRCGLTFSDMYDHLYIELPDDVGKESEVGGDDCGDYTTPVKAEQKAPAIVILPLVEIGETGMAKVSVPLPDHTGALAIMAVAFDPECVGSSDAVIRMRHEITVQLTSPRALSPGDELEVTAQVFNHDLPEQDFRLQLEPTGPVTAVGSLIGTARLDKGGEKRFTFRLKAEDDDTGPVSLTATLRAGNAEHVDRSHLSVRPPSPPVQRFGFEQIAANTKRTFSLRDEWFQGTGRTEMRVSTSLLRAGEIAGAMRWLRRYPYGCLEQTTSSAFPLLYAAYAALGDISEDDARAFVGVKIHAAIERIMLMELPSGGFAMWPGGRQLWRSGSIYAAHFLAESRELGYTIDEALWQRTLEFLRATVYRTHTDCSAEDRGYALYVLAQAGRAEPDLAESLATASGASRTGRIFAAASLTRAGRSRAGTEALRGLLGDEFLDEDCDWDMDSPVRRAGLVLNVCLDVMPESPATSNLLSFIRGERTGDGHWGSTQNNAMTVLALGKWARSHRANTDTKGVVHLANGTELQLSADRPLQVVRSAADEAVWVESSGPGPLFCSWESSGVPRVASREPIARGMSVSRRYLDMKGNEVVAFRQGDLVRVELTLRSPHAQRNVVVVDLLPGGLEVEDDTLATRWSRGDKAANGWVDFSEKLDDRLLLFCGLSGAKPFTFSYDARAVSRGRFVIPRIAAECMYNPSTNAVSGDLSSITVE